MCYPCLTGFIYSSNAKCCQMRQSKQKELQLHPPSNTFRCRRSCMSSAPQHLQIASLKCLTFLEAKEIGIIGLALLLSSSTLFFPGRQLACRCNSCQTGCEHWRCRTEPFSQANTANTFAQFLHCHVSAMFTISLGHASRKGIVSLEHFLCFTCPKMFGSQPI